MGVLHVHVVFVFFENPLYFSPPPCLSAWPTTQLLTAFQASNVMPGQYQVSLSQLMVLATPERARACFVHIILSQSNGRHTAHRLGLLCRASLASRTPSDWIHNDSLILCSFRYSILPNSNCTAVTSHLLGSVKPYTWQPWGTPHPNSLFLSQLGICLSSRGHYLGCFKQQVFGQVISSFCHFKEDEGKSSMS